LDDAVVTLQAQFPRPRVFADRRDALQDSGRLDLAFGPPHQLRQITGLDVAVVNAGRISAAVYTFLEPKHVKRERRNVRPNDHGDKR
jgi:hypothetical protein